MDEFNKTLQELPVSIITRFPSLEQKIVFEAVVLPELEDVLRKYSSLLVCNNK